MRLLRFCLVVGSGVHGRKSIPMKLQARDPLSFDSFHRGD